MSESPERDHGDAEMLRALLDAHGFLDLPGVTGSLLRTVVRWCGARGGAAFVPREGGVVLAPGPTTFGEAAPERAALGEIGVAAVDMLLGGRAEASFVGYGPFGAHGLPVDAGGGESSVALAVRETGGRLVAALVVVGVGPEDRTRVHALLEGAGIAVRHALEVAGFLELVIKDDTANCFNRRHFEDALPEELARAARFRAPLSLIFFDLDNLKQVNSRHGHAMGSRTLYEVSVRVRARIRKFDKLFRFGGDEFCIVLPETEWHGALEVAERVRESLAGSNFLKGLVADHDGVPITASFGIASYPLHARSKDEMVVQADRAMQRVKNGTKNSIAIAEILGNPG